MTNGYPPTTAIFFLLLFRIHFTICVSYNPIDHFTIHCGSSDNSPSSYGRNWTADSGRFSLIKLYDSYKSSISTNSLVKTIPYNTARFSLSEFSYFLPVKTNGQKFIRLYFYPSSYARNFLRSDLFFSVTVGSHTLLKDFNPSITADATGEETILLEYCVHIGDPGRGLNITFTPNPSHQNAYAFVNGIEVVSMPTFLYYTNLSDSQGILLQYSVTNDKALQTAYRINVGGRQIPPENDTGMFRRWDPDKAYLKRERPRSVSAGHGLKPIYTGEPSYFAPDEVYMTARNYGTKETSKFNVTWEFEVDLGFIYMVRLHFCEFDEHIEKAGDRVFQIFINDALVESVVDVMLWTQSQNNVPVHRDYEMWMPMDGSSKKLNISIKLQPDPTARSSYRDVLLNGIEILKMSDSKKNLGGPNPDQPPSPPFLPKASNHNAQKRRVISILVGSASGFIMLSLIVLLTYRRFTRAAISEGNSKWRPKPLPTSEMNKSSLLSSDLCRCFSISEVKAATNNFDDSLIIGVGGFGNVYKGQIDNGSVVVAIKRLKEGSQQGLKEFQTEIEMLSQLRHHHLVSLIDYSTDGNEMILVYEFMARGTLRDHLYESDQCPLSWQQRMEISLGAARGLHYLHTGAKHAIIHRDIKSTNILIDENWMANISDFGLSKIGPSGITRSNINISTVVKGSIGYLDPEYYMCQRLTEKSDVHFFGVVLLEVLCGRPPIIRAVERQQQNIVEWVRRCVDENKIYETVDPFIKESITPESLREYTKIALGCLADDGNERPSMGDVMLGLESVMETLNRAKKAELGGALNEEITFDEG